MTITRAQLLSRAARRLGCPVGSISSGTATTAVLSGLINAYGFDEALHEHRLFMLDATAETDKERIIEHWDDLLGTARFSARITDTTYTSETYIVSHKNDYRLTEYRDALNAALRETNRTYRQVIPLAPDQRLVPLPQLDTVTGAADVQKVWVSRSPNLLHNEGFGLWQNGDSLAPDGWTLAGAGATVARVTGGFRSAYGATVTRVGADATLYQDIPVAVTQYLTRSNDAPLTTLEGRVWLSVGTAARARIGIYNGTSTTYGSYHTGTGEPQFLTVSYTPTATDTTLRLVISVDTGNVAATVWWAGLVATDDDFPVTLRDIGSAGYAEYEVDYRKRNVGGLPVVELPERQQGQLLVYSLRAFPELSADTGEIEDEYARCLEAGLLAKLLEVRKPDQDRTRLDAILVEQRSIWNRLNSNALDLPVPEPSNRVLVTGA